MRREGPDAPDESKRTADLAEADRAQSADGLPLPGPDDAETRLARDAGAKDEAPGEETPSNGSSPERSPPSAARTEASAPR